MSSLNLKTLLISKVWVQTFFLLLMDVLNQFRDFVLDPDPYSSNFDDPDTINPDPHHYLILHFYLGGKEAYPEILRSGGRRGTARPQFPGQP